MDNDQYLENVLVFVDRNGTIEDKHSTPMSCSLKMKYENKDLKIKMHAYSHGMGNGSCSAQVRYKGKLVYKASGCYTAGPFNTEVEKYIAGDWEQLISFK